MNGSSIVGFLQKSLDENVVVSVFSDKEQPEKCAVGYIAAISDDHVLINHITPSGLNDGYVIRRMENIFRIDIGGQYESKMNLLYILQKQHHKTAVALNQQHRNLNKELLSVSQGHGYIINVCVDDTEAQDSIIGFVTKVDDSDVVIHQILENGEDNGFNAFFLDDIVKLNCDSEDERGLKLLFEAKNV